MANYCHIPLCEKREFDIDPAFYNAPSVLVRKEIELQGRGVDCVNMKRQ